MPWRSIPHAYEYWRLSRRQADPPSNLEDAERFILNEPPRTARDAACILDVVRAYYGDARCDGLDQDALARLHHYLLAADQ